jgi:RNA polymerase sigma factor (sigma-70 family)
VSLVELAQAHSIPWSVRMAGRTEAAELSADGRLLVSARRRDPAAFEMLVRRHQAHLYNFCFRMLGQSDDAADVAQDTFIQLYGNLGKLNEREPLTPWLFRVARNRCIDLLRRRRTVPLEPSDTNSDDPNITHEPATDDPLPDELVERADLQRLLGEAIARLPTMYAEVVALRYAADRSFAEIGIILDCDEGAARVRFHRAKALLRQDLRHLTTDDLPNA